MRKVYASSFYPKCFFLIFFGFFIHQSNAQFTLSTAVPSGVVYVSDTEPGVVIFGVRNTNSSPIIITDLSSYVEPLGSGTYTLWYHPTAVTGAPSAITTANGWIQLAPSGTVTATSNAVIPILSGLNLTIPANTTYRLALEGPIHGPYYGTVNSTGDLFSGGGVLIYAQANVNSPTYAGIFPTLSSTFTPRSFYGSITFSPANTCIDPPTPGNATASVPSACLGANITLDLTANSIGTGQTYQWQSSPDNSTWVNIGGSLTSPTLNTTMPGVTTYFRAAVTCGATTSHSASVMVTYNGAPVSGTFTINNALPTGGGNFQNFAAAINSLSCGVNGPVVFNVAAGSGPYNEQITIPAIAGVSAVNTITFNGNGRTLAFNSSNSGARAVVDFNGADFITIDNLVIDAPAGTYGWGVWFNNAADNNTISNCTINVSPTNTTSSAHAGIVMSNSATSVTGSGNNGNNNTITGNTINGGYHGIVCYGSSTAGAQNVNNIVNNNTVQNVYGYSIYLGYQSGTIVRSNNILRPTRSSSLSGSAGVYVTTGNVNTLIEKNRIHNMFDAAATSTSTFYALYASADGAAGQENKFINNLVYNVGGNGALYGLYNTAAPYTLYYHNTVAINDQSATTGAAYGFYQTGAAASIDFRNNIVTVTRSGTGTKRCLYFVTTTSSIVSNRNVLFMNAAAGTNNHLGQFGTTNFTILADWQTANGGVYDQQSVSTDPLYVNPAGGDYTPAETTVGNIGDNLGVTTDILNNPRSAAAPDPGAYEFGGLNLCTNPPTAGTAITSDAIVCIGVNFALDLTGNSVGDNQTYQWQSSPDNSTWTSISSALLAPAFVTTQSSGTTYYRAAVQCSGGTIVYSTSVQVVTPGLVSGTFSINNLLPTGGTNFNSFNDAYNYIKCGINGPVVFNVQPGSGPYNEQLIINSVFGTSDINTVTFNGSGTDLTFSSSNANERATIKLNGADHFIFDSLTISATGTYGFTVQLINDADSNIFRKCTIISDAGSTSTNFAGVVISASATGATTSGGTSLSDGNLFDGNKVIGGYYGMTMVGGSGSLINNNSFVNNIVNDFYLYGIYLSYTDNALVEKNSVSRPLRTSLSTFYGIYFTTGSQNGLVSKNSIAKPNPMNTASTSTLYGIYFTGCDAPAGSPNIVSNNQVYGFDGAGDVYGFYNSSSDNVKYYHNTISFDNVSNASTNDTRGFYQTTTAAGIEFTNNIITITRGGGGPNHGIYLATAASSITSNYNDIFLAPAATNYTGYNGSNQATLPDWQAATGKDANSVAMDPQYFDISIGNLYPVNTALNNLGTPVGILTDILDAVRNTTTPDIGAYEFGATCTNPPVPGTITTTSNPACIGAEFTLGITGGTLGGGQTYQWQSSPDNIAWSDIPGATSTALTTSQLVTTYYRFIVTCGTSVASASIQIVSPAAVAGTFTINDALPTAGTNFNSFNDAYNYLKCGINGPVVFNVDPASGPYTEQLIITPVFGSSSVNTITFNGNGRILQFTSTNTNERAVIKLNGADHFIFDSLTVNATATTTTEYGFGIQLLNDADSNIVRSCTINITAGQTSLNHVGISISASATSATTTGNTMCDDNLFEDNNINGGYYGITNYGSNTVANQRNKFLRNTIKDFYLYGLANNGTFQTAIDGNDISRPARTVLSTGTAAGIYFTGLSTSAKVNGNYIHDMLGGNTTLANDVYGIYFTGVDALAGLENIVSNNVIYNIRSNGIIYGLYNAGSDNTFYYHNTISLEDNASTTTDVTRGFYQTTSAAGIVFRNNIITLGRGGTGLQHGLYFNTAASAITSNNNDVFFNPLPNIFFGYNGTDQAILADWQAATGQDANSVSNNPLYINPAAGNLKPTNAVIDDLGAPLGITTDIVGLTRSVTTPDIGAYEFAPPPCTDPPTPGTATVSQTPVCENFLVALGATGYSIGSGQTYQWQASVDLGGPYSNISGVLNSPSFTITASETIYYRLAVTCNSNTQYSVPVLLTVSPALPGGTYTINPLQPASATNFTSFNAAKDAMACGIAGPVVFDVEPGTGPYLEQLLLDSIPGTSVVNTITFNGNGTTIQYSSSVSADRSVIRLNGTDYTTFNDLIIDATGTGTYGWGVLLTNGADSNAIRNCTILSSTSSTSTTNFAGIVLSGSATSITSTTASYCDGNVFENNTVTGGYYGISMMSSSAAPTNYNKAINNNVTDFYSYGIHIGYTNNALIERNTISRPTRSTVTTFNGIYFTSACANVIVSKNRLRNPTGANNASTSAMYGIYIDAADAPSGQPVIVSNNLISDFNGAGIIYGFYNAGSNNIHYYHNTISLDNTANTSTAVSRGFFQTTDAAGIVFKNNIITITRGGTGLKHGIYFGTSTSTITSDRNDFYVNGAGGANHVGYNGANRTTLSDWQTNALQDANSLSVDPQYTSLATDNYIPQAALIDNIGEPVGITTDIQNLPRSLTTPDIGAHEFAVTLCVAPPVAGVSVVNPGSGLCLGQRIVLNLTGNSTGGLQKYIWQQGPSATGPWTDISDTLYSPLFNFELSSYTNNYFRSIVVCGTSSAFSVPVQITLNPALIGDYTIDPALPASATNFQSFAAAVTALQCGIAGSVRFHAVPGTYTEQIIIKRVPGASAVSTVTFMSQNGNSSSVVLTYDATNSAANYVLKLDSASYITFRNLSVTAVNTTNGIAIEFAGTASVDSILNCIIDVPPTANTANSVVGIFGTGLTGSGLVIKGNTLTDGSSNIYLSGTAGRANAFIIDSNIVGGAYYYGIYAGGINNININRNTVTRAGILNTTAYGIYTTNCDSLYKVDANNVTIENAGTTKYGIYLTGCAANASMPGSVSRNKIVAVNNITSTTLYGLYQTMSLNNFTVNNIIDVRSTGTTVNGIYSTGGNGLRFYNNSVRNSSVSGSANNTTAYFSQASGISVLTDIRNNVFTHQGGGIALNYGTLGNAYSDYNMIHTNGTILVRHGTNAYTTLPAWKDASNLDFSSIVYPPAFLTGSDLQPDIANPDVWAMHGRGVQIPGNATDYYGNTRPTTLTSGVPDLGAYEFLPTVLPPALPSTPATPSPGTTQVFMFGSDTVQRIYWAPASTVPNNVELRRYSGIIPPGLTAGQQSMYFYTDIDFTGSAPSNFELKQFYVESWLRNIPSESVVKLGRTDAANTWIASSLSRIDSITKYMHEQNLSFMEKFTGMTDGQAPPPPPPPILTVDSSNKGKRFWVGYAHSWDFFSGSNNQNMVLYFSADNQPANVTVKVNGTDWVRYYSIPANTVISSNIMPKSGPPDARLLIEGMTPRGISIESDVPITAYAHIYSSTNSGATMLLPVGTYGYEYYTLNSRQNYTTTNSHSSFFVIADRDSTYVEITPSNPTVTGHAANTPFTVMLNRGDVYQLLGAYISGSEGYDLTGSIVKSVPNAGGKCYPIAVFAGSTRTGLGCGTSAGGSGDVILQQIFPYQAWGLKYLTAPTSIGTSASSFMTNKYRVLVKSPATVVTLNGVPLTGLINNRYYQFESNTTNIIEADEPVMVAQYMSSSGSCPNTSGNGDPEMFYLSPVEQSIKYAGFYRNNLFAIDENYLTLIIPTAGLASLTIDGSNTFTHTYPHSQSGYSVVVQRWTAGSGQSVVLSDSAFTGIVYGLGSVESYGYNVGTLVKNLSASPSINNVFNTGNTSSYTCKGTPFNLRIQLSLRPTQMIWNLSQVPNMSPNADVIQNNPTPIDSVTVNGKKFYIYALPLSYSFNAVGNYFIPITVSHPSIEGCGGSVDITLGVSVITAPVSDFTVSVPNCINQQVQFNATTTTSNGVPVNQWTWNFGDNSTAAGQNPVHTYATAGTFNVALRGIADDGCVGDTTKQLVINANPIPAIVQDTLYVCNNASATFNVQNPVAGATYNWYSAATGGTLLGTGTSVTVNNVTGFVNVYLESIVNGCPSDTRDRATAAILPALTAPVAIVDSVGVNFIRFRWNAITNATGYQVSTNNGATWTTPSSGSTGLTHTVSGLTLGASVTLQVRALGGCQPAVSAPVTGQTRTDEVFIPNSFTPNGDGRNDVLRVYSNVIRSLKFVVFNQWGEKIFESSDPNMAWDGIFKGKPQPSGVYIYVAEIIINTGERIDRKGAINLVR